MRPLLPFALFSLLALGPTKGEPAFGQGSAEPPVRFERVEHATGPSHNTIFAITQDRQGFLWLGTLDGLNRFDGYEFTVYRHDPADTTSLVHSTVNVLLEDDAGRFWVGTEGGLERRDRSQERFVHYRLGEAAREVTVLFESADGAVWAGTDGGLFRYESARDRFKEVEGPGRAWIHGMAEDAEGRRWVTSKVAGQCCGLFMSPPGALAFAPVFLPDTPDAPSYTPDQAILLVDRTGALWMGTARFGHFNASTGRFDQPRPPSSSELTWTFIKGRDGTLWVAGVEGVVRLDPATGVSTRHAVDPDSPDRLQEQVATLYEDRAGTLWAGTYGGLYRYDRRAKPFTHWAHDAANPKSLSGSIVMALYEDAQGVVWAGTYGGGLTALDRAAGTVRHFRHDPARPAGLCSDLIVAIHGTADGRLWLGSENKLCINEPRTGRFAWHAVPSTVWTMTEGSDGALWLGAHDGVYRFDPRSNALRALPHTRRLVNAFDGNVMSLHLEGDSVLWVGTGLQRLYRVSLATGRSRAYPLVTDDGRVLQGQGIWAIHPGRDGALWLGAATGLSRFDPTAGTFRHYFERDGLPGSVVYSILEDERGRLWLGTNQGLARFDPATESFRVYDERDGIGSTEFNRHAAYKSASGEFFFGGMKGLTAFYPEQIKDDDYVPPVALTRIQASNREGVTAINPFGLDRLVLSYRDYFFSFEFAALSFTNAERNRYAYRLEGFDEGWVEAGTRRFAGYTNIPPGDYVFRVRGSNSDGVWNEEGAALLVTITPPWWGTLWFRLLALGGMIGLLALAYRAHVRRLLQRARLHQLAEDKRRSEKEARRLAELDAAKSRFFANVSHEFRTPLTLILGPLEKLEAEVGEGQREAFGTIRRSARRLLRLIDQLLDLSKLEAGRLALAPQPGDLAAHLRHLVRQFAPLAERRQITLTFRSETRALPVAFDAEKVTTIVDNLISNALKFTQEGGKVLVALSESKPDAARENAVLAEIVVKDTGPGIPKEALPRIFDRFEQVNGGPAHDGQQGTGIGLALAKELAELHGGTLRVESEAGFGSAFIVRLPLERMEEEGERSEERGESASIQNGETLEAVLQAPPSPVAVQSVLTGRDNPQSAILLVEDNAEVRALLRGVLEADYRILEAADGEEGLALAREHTPDLVLSDVMMPKMDGVALCRALKADPDLATIPVVLLTAKASDEAAVDGLAAGADAYVTKPFHTEVLRAKVAGLLAARRAMRERFSRQLIVPANGMVVTSEEEVFLQAVLGVIAERLGESMFGVDALAEEVGLSRRQLERRLKEAAGQTPAEMIRQMRLERASQLLQARAGSVSEVAYAVGYKSANYFSTAFKEAFGHVPSEHFESAS